MGAIAVIGGMALLGGASGAMGSIGQNKQAQAQYLANKVQVERQNFQQALANDRANFAAARKNALRKWNNQKIAEAAVTQYADAKRYSRKMFQANSKNLANQQIALMSRLQSEATGKNLRGGMVERMKTAAKEQAKQARLNNRNAQLTQDLQAAVSYENMLNQRDMLSYETANIQIPGSTGVAPGGQTLGLLTGIISGGAGGAASGIGMSAGLNQMGVKGF